MKRMYNIPVFQAAAAAAGLALVMKTRETPVVGMPRQRVVIRQAMLLHKDFARPFRSDGRRMYTCIA
jgi:hypothetical protein